MASSELVFCFGPGGSGKTSVSAALAVAHAAMGKRVCCITIDPSKRLASALGLKPPFKVDPTPTKLEFMNKTIQIDAMAMNINALLCRLVQDLAPDKYEEILKNRIFQIMAEELVGLEHYMAIDVLARLRTQHDYDVVIVDTPPTRHAVEFLRGPERMLTMFSHQFFSFFVRQYGALSKTPLSILGGLYKLGTRFLERFFGLAFLKELAQFFGYFELSMQDIREKINVVVNWIHHPHTRCVLIGYEYMQASEMNFYLQSIRQAKIKNGSFLFNQSMCHLSSEVSNSKQSADWLKAIRKRIAIQEASIQDYKKWAAVHQLSFYEIPWILDKGSPKDIILNMATVLSRETLVTKR